MLQFTSRLGITRAVVINSARAVVATVASMLLARLLKLPEFYWAPISTIVVLLSTVDPLTVAWQRFAGTALGATLGALIGIYFQPTLIVYGAGIFVCGILCALLRIGSAYRFAAITLSIVLLIAHTRSPWIVAMHRFVEVSLGITVALAVTVVWRAPQAESKANPVK
ncbi:MAG: FUSC family protein [Candidatus Sulfotelmatobacter sp.]